MTKIVVINNHIPRVREMQLGYFLKKLCYFCNINKKV